MAGLGMRIVDLDLGPELPRPWKVVALEVITDTVATVRGWRWGRRETVILLAVIVVSIVTGA